MRCASALSTVRNTDAAFADVLGRVAAGLDGTPADLAVVFSSSHHADRLGELAPRLAEAGLGVHLIGCTGESVVGEGREIEGSSALCLWSITLPGAALTPVRLSAVADGITGWPEGVQGDSSLLLMGDPFTFPAEDLLKRLNADAPGLRVVGGMASAGRAPGQNRLLLDGETYRDGAVGLLLGGVALRTVVSQGCRPIGRPLIVTKVEANVVRELGRRPALEVLRELFAELDEHEQTLVREGLHVGRVINEYQETFKRGDFLVRNVIGVDPAGGIALTDHLRVGQTVQFHVRDAATADEDLRLLLAEVPAGRPVGALLFSCNGRGSRLFSSPDHDASTIAEVLGPIPVAGFFAMGEVGPVGGQNFLHGFTASMAIFERPSPM